MTEAYENYGNYFIGLRYRFVSLIIFSGMLPVIISQVILDRIERVTKHLLEGKK